MESAIVETIKQVGSVVRMSRSVRVGLRVRARARVGP